MRLEDRTHRTHGRPILDSIHIITMISNNNLTGNNAQGQPAPEAGDAARRRKRILLYCAAGVLVVAIAVVAWLVFSHMAEQKAKEQAEIEAEARNLDLQQQLADSEFESLEKEFRHQVLSERMTLAEKLNVTGVNLRALNKKGKNEKKVAKAKQLVVTFTLPPNNSTPVGEKTIFVRIISPEGNLLGNGGSFGFEGANVPCTARKVIEYTGEEIAGIPIYWDVTSALSAGRYTVELFADNYRLASRSFELK